MALKFVFLTDRQIKLYTTKIYKQILSSGEKFTKVVGIERGGLHVSVPLAKMLNVQHCSIRISFYPDENQHIPYSDPLVETHGVEFTSEDNLLFVDDLVDSGSTLKYFQEKFRYKHKSAVLLWNPLGRYNVAPDYFAKHKLDAWIVFPWDQKQQKAAK